MANCRSTSFFYDAVFGSVVPTAQFDVLEALDQPWITSESRPALRKYWGELSNSIDTWANDARKDFFPKAQRIVGGSMMRLNTAFI